MVESRETVAKRIAEAQQLARQRRANAVALLNDLFREGSPPSPPLDGFYAGKLVLLDIAPGLTQLYEALVRLWLPWKGKAFDAARGRGVNVFARGSLPLAHLVWPGYRGYVAGDPTTYRAFAFRTCVAPGLADPDRHVLKIDYDLETSPRRTIRRVLDELVQLAPGMYLGKAHMHWWWGRWQCVAYFALAR